MKRWELIGLVVLFSQWGWAFDTDCWLRTHYLTIDVLGAYEQLQSPTISRSSGVSTGLQVGYGFKYKHLLLQVGTQMTYHALSTLEPDYTIEKPSTDSQNDAFMKQQTYTNVQKQYSLVDIVFPVGIGGQWHHFFTMVKPQLGYRIYGQGLLSSQVSTTGLYDPFLEPFHDMPNHGFETLPVEGEKHTVPNAMFAGIGAQIGYCFCEDYKPFRIRKPQCDIHLSAFANYQFWSNNTTFASKSWMVGINLAFWITFPKHLPCRCIEN
ncbi:MAG: hypothetical protein MJZ58_01060 [Paludibacteraceae bacterium]|nr:hypothetical protein [Paludibacteraceae bacterium]